MSLTAICIHTTNDTNGNARRAWLIFEGGKLTSVIKQGANGRTGIAVQLRAAGHDASEVINAVIEGLELEVTPREWRTRTRGAK